MANSATGNQKPETFLLSPGAAQSLPQQAQIALHQVDNLKYFLISAPVDWTPDQYIRRFLLPTGEYVSCILWNNLFHISGTDIVRCLAFRFQAFGRPVKNSKKFEEGIFSDLRNLKAGNDASLEEPKSAFLDFLYKNNCIRTQKKQKVFYWYSVPHDRLFLDALERDLKREKAGQEATTVANFEPALSFEFDASQSLFEQLTKAQQQSGAGASAPSGPTMTADPESYDQSVSPVDRAQEQMPPPPSMVSQAMHNMPQEAVSDMAPYNQSAMPVAPVAAPVRQDQYGNHMSYDRPAIPMTQQQRHSSVPPYMEYSPAPSFVSSQSHFDDYSARGISYEPITPPQATNYAAEPAYTTTEDNGLYNALSDMPQNYGAMGTMAPPSYGPVGYTSVPKPYPTNPVLNNVYSHIEGSPNYKQRRRRSPSPYSSAASSTTTTARPTHPVRKHSDLRRSLSAIPTMTGTQFERAASGPPAAFGYINGSLETSHMSRHGSPISAVDDQQQSSNMMQQQNRYGDLMSTNYNDQMLQNGTAGAFRRARSATTDISPYPQKSHSCPIPSCGRLFKRLEHLKRHVRTHTQERPYVCPHCSKAFSRSDNLAQHRRTHEGDENGNFPEDVNEDDLDAAEESFPALDDPATATPDTPEHNYLQGPPQALPQQQQQPLYQHPQQQYPADIHAGHGQQQSYDAQIPHHHYADAQAMDMFGQRSMGPPPLPSSIAQQGY